MATTQNVNGTVYDPSGNKVSGATVSCRNVNTDAVVSTTSDGNGRFTFTVNVGGDYVFTAEKNGVTLSAQLDPEDGVTTSTGLKY